MTEQARIKLTRGVPPVESFPTEHLAECAAAALAEYGDVVLQYGPSRGFPPLLDLIAQEETAVPERQVITGPGSLQLQDFCARLLCEKDDLVYVEEPSYDRTLTVFRRAGARVVGFPLEEDGLDVETVEKRLRQGERPVLIYLIPDFQNPSGKVLSEEKRRRIVALAREYGFWIIEDAPYRKLRYRGAELSALFDLAPERVLFMSSYSKLISPGLRVGYVVTPAPLADGLAKMAEDTYINPSYFNQAIVYEFIRRGWLEPHLAQLKSLYAARLDAMLAALEEHMSALATWSRPDGGFFIGLTLRRPVPTDELLARALDYGLVLSDGRGFFANGGGDGFVRLPFCSLTPKECTAAVARLAQVVESLEEE